MAWFEGYLGLILSTIAWKGSLIDTKRSSSVETENARTRASLEKFKDTRIVKGHFEICNAIFWP